MPRLDRAKLNDGILKIVSAANKGPWITGGDQSRIQFAVDKFVNEHFHTRYELEAPIVEGLPKLLEIAIQKWGGYRHKPVVVAGPEGIEELCRQLADWINENYQKVPNKPWKGIGRYKETP